MKYARPSYRQGLWHTLARLSCAFEGEPFALFWNGLNAVQEGGCVMFLSEFKKSLICTIAACTSTHREPLTQPPLNQWPDAPTHKGTPDVQKNALLPRFMLLMPTLALAGCMAEGTPLPSNLELVDPASSSEAQEGNSALTEMVPVASETASEPSQAVPRAAASPDNVEMDSQDSNEQDQAEAVPQNLAPEVEFGIAECPSYDDGFLPLVHAPVCGNCHGVQGGLPNWEPFAAAERSCRSIGALVANEEMPPNGALSQEQRDIVARWVALDCPETPEQATALCQNRDEVPVESPAPENLGDVNIVIDRARYRVDDDELEVRGEVNSSSVELVVEFNDRIEEIANDDGEFRASFESVVEAPALVIVRASDGSSAQISVEIDD